MLPGSWWRERQRRSSGSFGNSRGGRKSNHKLWTVDPADGGVAGPTGFSVRSEWIRSAAVGAILFGLCWGKGAEKKCLNKSVWLFQPACGGETGVFLCGVEECEGVSAVFGGQNGLSVLGICRGNTAADSCGLKHIYTNPVWGFRDELDGELFPWWRSYRPEGRAGGQQADSRMFFKLLLADVFEQEVVGGASTVNHAPMIAICLNHVLDTSSAHHRRCYIANWSESPNIWNIIRLPEFNLFIT